MLPIILFIAKCVAVDDSRYRNCVSALPNHSTPIDPHEATPHTMRYDAMQYLTTRYFNSQFHALSHSAFQYEAMQYITTCFNACQYIIIRCNTIHCRTVQYTLSKLLLMESTASISPHTTSFPPLPPSSLPSLFLNLPPSSPFLPPSLSINFFCC